MAELAVVRVLVPGLQGAALAFITGTSTTSLTVGLTPQTITLALPWTMQVQNGQRLRVASSADADTFMSGIVSAWNPNTGTFTFTPDDFGGSGTIASWNISVTGEKGEEGLDFIGVLDTTESPTIEFPAATKGDFYVVSGDGNIGGLQVSDGDTFLCLEDTGAGDWVDVQLNWAWGARDPIVQLESGLPLEDRILHYTGSRPTVALEFRNMTEALVSSVNHPSTDTRYRFNAFGRYEAIGTDSPAGEGRIDHDPTTRHARGLYVGAARSNSFAAGGLDSSIYTEAGIDAVSAVNDISAGGLTLSMLEEDGTSGEHKISASVANLDKTTTRGWCARVKRGTGSRNAAIRITSTADPTCSTTVAFNLATGAQIGSHVSGGGGTVISRNLTSRLLQDGVVEALYQARVDPGGGGNDTYTMSVLMADTDGAVSYSGDGTSTIYCSQFQNVGVNNENATFKNLIHFIPPATSEAVEVPTVELAGLIDARQGGLYIEFILNQEPAAPTETFLAGISGDGATNAVSLRNGMSTGLTTDVSTIVGASTKTAIGSRNQGAIQKALIWWDADAGTAFGCMDGADPVALASYVPFTLTAPVLYIGNSVTTALAAQSWIVAVAILPLAPSAGEAQSLTAP